MDKDNNVENFLAQYDDIVYSSALKLRKLLLSILPGIIERVDEKARMIAYCYGNRYIELICTVIPSKKGLKLGFYRGVDLPDPDGLLKGTGKISRYVDIKSDKEINSPPLRKLIEKALEAYRERTKQ